MEQIYIEDFIDNKMCKDILSLNDVISDVIIYVCFKNNYTELELSFLVYCNYNETKELHKVCETILNKYNLTTKSNYRAYQFSGKFYCDSIDLKYRYEQTKKFISENLKNPSEFIQLESSCADYFSQNEFVSDILFLIGAKK